MIQNEDREVLPYEWVAPYYPDEVKIYDNSDVTPLIDGNTYFNDLYSEIVNLHTERLNGVDGSEQGIYLCNWVFEETFAFPNGANLITLLKSEAQAGVDVKVLLWVNDYAMDTRSNKAYWLPFLWFPDDLSEWPNDNLLYVNVQNLRAFINLTQRSELEDKIMLNTLDYPAGGCHMKFVLVFGRNMAIGYTGGVDFGGVRKSDQNHIQDINGNLNNWHDVQVKIQGEAFEPLFEHYKSIWNELIDKYSTAIPEFLLDKVKYPAVQRLGSKITANGSDLLLVATNNQSVQSLRTVPDQQFKFSMFTPIDEPEISFAPYGVYEIQLALKKAIENAESYIYIEDQAVASREVLGYLQQRIQQNDTLKVIILTSLFDASGFSNFTRGAISQYLLKGLENDQKEQVVIYSHWTAKVHSKVYIIDDKFAIIGSAGMFNRALFVEWEHSISFIDSDSSSRKVKDFRIDLWAEHFRVSNTLNEKNQINDLDSALNVWKGTWGVDNTSFKLPGYVAAMTRQELVSEEYSFAGTHSYPASLVPVHLFAKNVDGNGIPYKSGAAIDKENGEHKDFINEPAQFVAGGINYIEDEGFPNPSEVDLADFWILILNGPNEGECLEIIAHSDYKIYVNAMPIEFDSTNSYVILATYLKQQFIREYVLEVLKINWRFESFDDVGYLQPLPPYWDDTWE